MVKVSSTQPRKYPISAVFLLVVIGLIGNVDAAPAPTFSKDVAPILQRSCQRCHQKGGIGPMSLVTYDQVRPWVRQIKDRVVRRIMPPWHIDRTVGIQEFKNDVSLTESEIGTIARWVDDGAREGNPSDLPSPIEWPPASEWELAEMLGQPDLVVRSPPYTVRANGQDQWWNPVIPFEGITEPRWIKAAEFKPSYPLGVRVVHHGHVRLQQPDDDFVVRLAGMGVGKRWELMPEGVGKLVQPGPAQIRFSLHYFPVGEEVPDDVVEVGVWFHPKGYTPDLVTAGEVRHLIDGTFTTGPRARDMIIPPHGHLTLQHAYTMDSPVMIHSFRPHMHMRGSGMSMEALYPDGRRELLSSVNRYDHNWQIAYIYEDDVQPILPKGTVILLHSHFDNTKNNPINPDPDQWVLFGARGVDEMSHAWIGMTYLDDESFSRLTAERRALQEKKGVSSVSCHEHAGVPGQCKTGTF
tara:strand:- start:23053 stop:24450 length:1398 start_codon:yes stop_codon:yes gene_type:complete